MRVIGGRQNRQRLETPDGLNTRPILDRVKQALFDALGARLATPGTLPPINVLDVYCGGGTLGIESLSRGAATCTFVERERNALKCLRANLERTGLAPRAQIVAAAAESAVMQPIGGPAFDLIFLDPPFPASNALAKGSPLQRVFERLGTDLTVSRGAICIWRYDSALAAPDEPGTGWRTESRRTYGRSTLSWLVRAIDNA